MPERYYQHTFANGLTLLGENMPGMQSAAMTLATPAGSTVDPEQRSGLASVMSDLILRGAGDRDSRQLTDYLDSLGLQRSSSVGVHHMRLSAAAVAERVMRALPTYADILRRPQMPEDGFEAARDLSIQSLDGIEDDPRQKVLILLRQWHFPYPFGRNTMGEKEDLEKLTLQECRQQHRTYCQPAGSVLAVAGQIDFAELKSRVEDCLGDWQATPLPPIRARPAPGPYYHQDHKSEQTHIGIAYPSIQETDPEYYIMRLGIETLSGGMSGRLFTEIREKRALVYNVWAGYSSLKGYGSIMGYAGTSNDRAQATLDTLVEELQRLSDGITAAELDRSKTGLKSGSIMQGESTSARSGSIAHDYFMRGRIRTLDEIKAAIDGVTLDQVNAWLKRNRPEKFTIVTVGPKELTVF